MRKLNLLIELDLEYLQKCTLPKLSFSKLKIKPMVVKCIYKAENSILFFATLVFILNENIDSFDFICVQSGVLFFQAVFCFMVRSSPAKVALPPSRPLLFAKTDCCNFFQSNQVYQD